MTMTFIPLVYFSFLSLFLYKRHKQFDMAAIISMIFAISGLFSVLIDFNGLRSIETENYEISIIPAVLYCLLLTICIIPISNCNVINKVQITPVRNVKLIKILAIIALIWFLLSVRFGWNIFRFVLMSDMAEIRHDAYAGFHLTWMDGLPWPIRIVFSFFNMLFGCPWILLFLGLYSTIGNRVPLFYSYCFLIASLSGPFNGIIWADRSATAYWIMAAGALYLLFRKQIPSKVKKQLFVLGMFVLGGLIAYLVAMTTSRFGERLSEGGSMGSLISYFGQSYINFCYFFDRYNLPHHHFGVVFPFISEYVFGIPSGGVVIQEQMTGLSNMSTGVFYTFIGHIMVGTGQLWAVMMTLLYAIMSGITLGRVSRGNNVDIQTVYLYFGFVSVILLGLFGHYYASASKTFSLFAMYLVIRMLRKS